MGAQDYYEGQIWKRYPGASNLVSWCVRNIQVSRRCLDLICKILLFWSGPCIWRPLAPHHSTRNDTSGWLRSSIQNTRHKNCFWTVPSGTHRSPQAHRHRRTSVHSMSHPIFIPSLPTYNSHFTLIPPKSLSTSLTNLHNPFTPTIIRTAIPTTLTLINLTNTPGSQIRFDKLCALLGDSIIGNIWIYASMEPESVQATLDVIPGVIEMLGIGCTRYLKALVPQLIHPLLPSLVGSSREMQLSSLRALHVLIDECSPRIPRWKGTILDAVTKCWVGIIDSGANDPGTHGCSFSHVFNSWLMSLRYSESESRSPWGVLQTCAGLSFDTAGEVSPNLIAGREYV